MLSLLAWRATDSAELVGNGKDAEQKDDYGSESHGVLGWMKRQVGRVGCQDPVIALHPANQIVGIRLVRIKGP